MQVNNPTNPNAGVVSSPFNETRYIGRLSSLALSHLSKCQHLRKFQAEDLLFNQGDHLDCLFVILDGVVGFTVDFGLDRHSWLYVAGPGSIVDLGIFSDPPISPVTTQALSDVKTIAIPRQCWLQELSYQPELMMEIIRRQNERLGLIERLGVMPTAFAASFKMSLGLRDLLPA